jgi:general L-amino acid transport system permease protein
MASTSSDSDALRPARGAFWNDPTVRAIFWQVVVLGAVAALIAYLVTNTIANLDRQNIASGFGFLNLEAGFAIGESLVEYHPGDTYGWALLVGLLNTIKVAVAGIACTTVIGVAVGILRLSPNWLMARLATVYVETLRNVPVLLQLFFWYSILVESLPHARQAYGPFLGFYLSNRGLNIPLPGDWGYLGLAGGFIAAILGTVWLARRNRRIHDRTGEERGTLLPALGLFAGLMLAGWLAGGAPTGIDMPKLKGFSFQGGGVITAEFLALWLGLTLYTAAFIAEIVRSGILSVGKGQWEAAGALGLRRGQILRFVVLPQALRVIVPPTTSQYLNLTKNSSLAVAIGFPDIVSVSNTTMNQTGQAIEGIAVIMAVYLTISLSISAFMNWYNRKIALVER